MGCGGCAEVKRLWSSANRLLSQSLDPREREIVLGDFAELGHSGLRALQGLLGLVLRRQVQPWKEWRPWFVLLAVVLPISPLLASLSDELGGQLFPVLVMWSHHRVFYDTGLKPSAFVFGFLLKAAALMVWSWSVAYALGALSRTTRYVQGIVLFLLCLTIGGSSSPMSFALLWISPWGWMPVVVEFLMVLLPGQHGLRHGAAPARLRVRWMLALAAGTAMLGLLAMWTRGWGGAVMENWSQGGAPLSLIQLASRRDVWQTASGYLLTVLVLTSPAFYLLAEAILRGHRGRPRSI